MSITVYKTSFIHEITKHINIPLENRHVLRLNVLIMSCSFPRSSSSVNSVSPGRLSDTFAIRESTGRVVDATTDSFGGADDVLLCSAKPVSVDCCGTSSAIWFVSSGIADNLAWRCISLNRRVLLVLDRIFCLWKTGSISFSIFPSSACLEKSRNLLLETAYSNIWTFVFVLVLVRGMWQAWPTFVKNKCTYRVFFWSRTRHSFGFVSSELVFSWRRQNHDQIPAVIAEL